MPPPVFLSVIMIHLLSSKESEKSMVFKTTQVRCFLSAVMGALRFNSLFSIFLSFAFLVYMSEREKVRVHATVAWFHASECAREGWILDRTCLFPAWVYIDFDSFKATIKCIISVQKMCFLYISFNSHTKPLIGPLKQLLLWTKLFKKVVLINEVLHTLLPSE